MYVLELPNIKRLINSAYRSELMIIYDDWCKLNCRGAYVVHSIDKISFERFEDREAFRLTFEMRIL